MLSETMASEWDAAEELDEVREWPAGGRDGSIAAVSANHDERSGQPEFGSSDGGAFVPDAVVDALVETVWALPGLRVSLSRLTRSHHLRFLACAGPEEMPPITGRCLHLGHAAPFLRALRTTEEPLEIEDVTTDPRTKGLARELGKLSTGSILVLPVRPRRPGQPGAILLDAPRPRTWTPKEIAAVERLEPLMALALENAALREQMGRAEASLGEYERQLGGARGLVGGIVHDTHILVDGLLRSIARVAESSSPMMDELQESATSLGRQLDAVLAELVTLERGAARILEPLDLNELVEDLAPALRSLMGERTRLLTQLCARAPRVPGHRTGLERALLNLVVHATNDCTPDSLVIETRQADDRAVVQIRATTQVSESSALRLLSSRRGRPATPDELGLGLWLVRCEVLLHGGSVDVDLGEDDIRIRVELPTLSS